VNPLASAAGKPPGWSVDVWFVGYGDWESVSSREFLESLLEPGGGGRRREGEAGIAAIEPEELARRQIRLNSKLGREEGYYRVPAELFERVELGATWRAVVTRGPHSVTIAARIDPRFNRDPRLPNYWRPLVRDAENPARLVPGDAQTYAYAGLYGRMTPLEQPAGAILVECHGVFEEPHGWFQGAPLLRSKLPMLVQEQVRAFRGRLAEAGK